MTARSCCRADRMSVSFSSSHLASLTTLPWTEASSARRSASRSAPTGKSPTGFESRAPCPLATASRSCSSTAPPLASFASPFSCLLSFASFSARPRSFALALALGRGPCAEDGAQSPCSRRSLRFLCVGEGWSLASVFALVAARGESVFLMARSFGLELPWRIPGGAEAGRGALVSFRSDTAMDPAGRLFRPSVAAGASSPPSPP
mmetsp:Transcript_14084/g.41933  ORF Transcript_14084/g.41933 Transcript_14084/m.41933 type:complete len:205 (-) Transcript_14084:654-1268(-)